MFSLKTSEYLIQIFDALRDIDSKVGEFVEVLKRVKENGSRLWVLGNGGSMAIAQHFAQDLLKTANVRAQAINCPSVLTAFSNDDDFRYSFYNPIRTLSKPGDPIFIFSCSGRSRNYIEFVSGFEDRRNPVLSVVGTTGGFLKEKSDLCLHVKSDDYQVCEVAFQIIADLIVKSLMEE